MVPAAVPTPTASMCTPAARARAVAAATVASPSPMASPSETRTTVAEPQYPRSGASAPSSGRVTAFPVMAERLPRIAPVSEVPPDGVEARDSG